MPSFSEILAKPTIFRDRNVLSPHFIPGTLPFREKEIEQIMTALSPALRNERPKNMFIYGKTGTGKTCSVKHVMEKLNEHSAPAQPGPARAQLPAASPNPNIPISPPVCYVNCRMYNSRYRVLQNVIRQFLPELDKSGFGISFIYEKLLEWLEQGKRRLILVLDEVDMVKDLDELIYTLTRANDELKKGSISLIGISNKLSFKEELDPRSKSSLYETEMVFSPYSAMQLQGILRQRAQIGFAPNSVDESAINLAAAIAAQETGDARYALRLLSMAGDNVDSRAGGNGGAGTGTAGAAASIAGAAGQATKGAAGSAQTPIMMTDKDVEAARRSVDESIAVDAISTLPEHQQLVLFGVASLTLAGSRYAKLGTGEEDEHFLLSGEVYEEYSRACRVFRRKKRSARWYREYLNDLEMLGLITTVESGKGMRGHTRLIKIGYPPDEIKHIIEKNLSVLSHDSNSRSVDAAAG